MIITLDECEMAIAYLIASMRRAVNRSSGIKDQLVDKKWHPLDRDIQGAIAEIAWAKANNSYPDLEIKPRKGSPDSIINGKRIDIKATSYKSGELQVTKGKIDKGIDFYVLAIVDGAMVDFKGYAFAKEVFQAKNLKDPGQGECYCIPQPLLHKFKQDELSEAA